MEARTQQPARPATLVDYDDQHDRDVSAWEKRTMKKAKKPRKTGALAKPGVWNLTKVKYPEEFTGKKPKRKGEMCEKELGRGSYGVVRLIKRKQIKPGQAHYAIKGQTPVGSLAWEYNMLKELQRRTAAAFRSGGYPFPRPIALVLQNGGGLMSIPAATEFGWTLDNVVAYFKEQRRVSQSIVLHYCIQILRTMEVLHRDAQILVRYFLVASRDDL